MRVKNNAREIEKALKLDEGSVKHLYNFVFKGTKGGGEVTIYTTPANGIETIESQLVKGI